jgi:hypothetical protein
MSLEDGAPPQAVGEELDARSPAWLREGISFAISPDDRFAAIALAGGGLRLVPLDGSPGRELSGTRVGDLPTRWSNDPKRLYVFELGELPAASMPWTSSADGAISSSNSSRTTRPV